MKYSNWDKQFNTIVNVDCIEGMRQLPNNIINLAVYSPPYNVGIDYDTWNDSLPLAEYWVWTKKYLTEIFRILKSNGRIAVNILYEANFHENGGRVFFSSEYWNIMKEVGFQWAGLVDLKESVPHRVKYSSWGSWLRSSALYIYNPKECVILAYKDTWSHEKKRDIIS